MTDSIKKKPEKSDDSRSIKGVRYVRVSTGDQSVDSQLSELQILADLRSINIVHDYVDVMSGGASNRPEFQQMLKDARKRKFEVILVSSLDRFSREGMVNTLTYLERLKKYQVAVISKREHWCDTTDEGLGEVLIGIVAWFAKQERQNISKNTKRTLEKYKRDLETQGFYINKKGEKKYCLGRPKGSKDKNPNGRNNLGYRKRWEK